MFDRQAIIAAALGFTAAAGFAASASAAEEADLRALLAELPASVFASAEQGYVEFLSFEGFFSDEGLPTPENFPSLAWGGLIRAIGALGAGPEQFAAKSGIRVQDIGWVAGFGTAPQELSFWGFPDAAAAQLAFDALPDAGFAPARFPPGTLANGTPGAMDFRGADAANPWLGSMGRTSMVSLKGSVLLQAGAAADFAPVLLAGETALESDAGRTALAGIEHSSAGIVQALVLSPARVGMQALDPVVIMGKSPEEARAALETAASNLDAGLPLYSAAILAEVRQDEGAEIILSLAYATCEDAAEAIARAPALWKLMNPAYVPAGAVLSGEPVEVASGCAARIMLTPTELGSAGNTGVLRSIMTGIQFRDIAILRIGSAPGGAQD